MSIAPDLVSADQPEFSPEGLLRRARELRPIVEEHASETNALTHISPEVHALFDEAGFYRMLMPKRYGGLEVDLPTYVSVWAEIAKGDISAAWCGCLAANHSLQLGSWWGEQAQDEIFGVEGGFKAASVAAPLTSLARRVEGGWELDGKVSYCSGIPYSTHYMGQALTEPATPGGPPGPPILFVAPRDAFTVLDDWGQLTGLVGSGSNSIVFDHAVVPEHWVLEATHMADVDPTGGTVGWRLHGNPLYNGRGLGFFTMTVGSLMIGGAFGALDEFANILKTRTLIRPPFGLRVEDSDHQRWYGAALSKISMAEQANLGAARLQMEYGRQTVEEDRPYTWGDDQYIGCIAREAYSTAWQAMQEWIFRYSGSSAARKGEKLERVLRDMATGWSHFNTANNEWAYTELAIARLDQPRTPLF